MKIVYFGSDLYLACFEYFVKEHEVLALYTYHNDEDYFKEYAIVCEALKHGIPVHYESITEEEITRLFKKDGCGLLFSAEYDRIIDVPKELDNFRGINVHGSLLPEGRGYYPIESAMQRGLNHIGVTMHKLAPKLDRGDIIVQHGFELTPETDSIDAYLENAAFIREVLPDVIGNIDKFWNEAKAQTELLPYWKRPGDESLTLNHDMTRQEALSVFKSFNSMTQLEENGEWFFVTGMTAGTAALDRDTFKLSDTLMLYRVADGHLRLHVQARRS